MQQLSVQWHRLRPRDFVGAVDICLGDLVAVHSDDSFADHRPHVFSGNSRIDRIDLRPRHPFVVFDGFSDGPRRFLDVRNYSTTQSGGAGLADAEDLEIRRAPRVGGYRLANYCRRLRGTDVESGDDVFRIH